MGGWANIAGGMSRVEGNSSSMGLSAPLANEMGGRVAVGEAICGGSDVAGSEAGVESNSRLSAPLAKEVRVAMGQAKGCGSNVAGGVAGVQGDSSAVGLGTPLSNMGVTPDCGSNIAGGETGVNCNTKTKAMRLGQGGGKEGGGKNKELHVASAFLPTAGGK